MKSIKSLINRLEKIKVDLAENRDKLRELQEEIEMYLEDKYDDIQNLESTIDSLSRYV